MQVLKNFLRGKNSFSTKASQVSSLVAFGQIGQPVWTPEDYASLAEQGYDKNVIVHRCVTLIARSIASVPWLLYEGEDEIDRHPLLTLLNKPNPFQGGNAFIESLISYLLLAGNVYIEAVCSDDTSSPNELYILRPDRVKVVPAEDGYVEAYTYTAKGQTRFLSADPEKAASPVLHIKFFHPLNDWYGLSPLCACLKAVDFHNAASAHNLSLLQNGGRPSGALLVKVPLSDMQRSQLRDDLTRIYEGTRNAGKLMVLEGDFEWKEMGLSPKELDFMEGKHVAAREIAQNFGVPPMLVGVPGDATFANYREARFHLWEDTILPLLDMVTSQLNLWLSSQFGENLWIGYDHDTIPALASRREDTWKKISNASFLTLNEKRQALGYEPLSFEDEATLLHVNESA